MVKLFLDDCRNPLDCTHYMFRFFVNVDIYREEWIIVRSYKEFVDYINNNGLPGLISFDHDLSDVDELKEKLEITDWFKLQENKEYTGYDCAKWLVDYCMDNDKELPEFIVHSANPIGAENIRVLLNNYKQFLKNGK